MISIIGLTVYELNLTWLSFASSYVVFIIINAALLVISSALYSFFNEMKSALVFSIIMFQVVMFTGDFTMPIAQAPKFLQVIAQLNPVYHINHVFIDVWNQMFVLNQETMFSLAYISAIVLIAFLIVGKKARI